MSGATTTLTFSCDLFIVTRHARSVLVGFVHYLVRENEARTVRTFEEHDFRRKVELFGAVRFLCRHLVVCVQSRILHALLAVDFIGRHKNRQRSLL